MIWFDELIAADTFEHALPPDLPPTRDASKDYFTQMPAAFPDLRHSIDLTVAEGDKVVQQLTGRGTMKAEFWGHSATGRRATWKETHISRFSNGKLVEHWAYVDRMSQLDQLGLPLDFDY